MAKKGTKQKRYSTEFKINLIMDMREHHFDDIASQAVEYTQEQGIEHKDCAV